MEQEIERSLSKAIDVLQKTKLQEGPQSLPEEHRAAFAAFRRDLETQQAALAEVVRQQLRACDFERRAEAALEKLRGDFDTAQQLQAEEYASVHVEWEQHRAQWSALEEAVSRMQEEVSVHASKASQAEEMARDVRGNVDALHEEVRQLAQSGDEFKSLHQDIVRSTGSLSRVIEDVSAAVAATERSLRQEMEETRAALEAAGTEQRGAIAQDQQDLRMLVESICKDIAQLQATAAADRSASANAVGMAERASHCIQEVMATAGEVMATAGDRLGRLETSLKRLESAETHRSVTRGAEGGFATSQDVQDIWDVLSMLRASLEARESAVRAEADTQSLEADIDPARGYDLVSRVAALERRGHEQQAACSRTGALVETLERLLGECGARPGSETEGGRSDALQVCIATPTGSGELPCGARSPMADLASAGVKGELLRAVKACASAALGAEADTIHTPDLTPAAVALLPTPQAPSSCGGISPPAKERIRV